MNKKIKFIEIPMYLLTIAGGVSQIIYLHEKDPLDQFFSAFSLISFPLFGGLVVAFLSFKMAFKHQNRLKRLYWFFCKVLWLFGGSILIPYFVKFFKINEYGSFSVLFGLGIFVALYIDKYRDFNVFSITKKPASAQCDFECSKPVFSLKIMGISLKSCCLSKDC